VFENLPQGVHARVFSRRHRVMESSKEFEPSKELKEGKRPNTLESFKKA
jgi:hypothetical protein